MHDAKLSSLSKVEVGQTILVVANAQPRGFGRPKDKTAIPLRVTDKSFVPDSWSGKQWTLTLNDGSTTEQRYGTTHVYVVEAAPEPQPEKPAPQVELDLATGTRRVLVEPDGTMRVRDWTGGTVIETTRKGRVVRIDDQGVLTLIKDFPEDEQLDERNASLPVDQAAEDGERCLQCKGYGVVRKRGSQAGKAYRTLNGSQAATVNGNAAECPVCQGTGLVGRAA